MVLSYDPYQDMMIYAHSDGVLMTRSARKCKTPVKYCTFHAAWGSGWIATLDRWGKDFRLHML
jgi:hypothetical protein